MLLACAALAGGASAQVPPGWPAAANTAAETSAPTPRLIPGIPASPPGIRAAPAGPSAGLLVEAGSGKVIRTNRAIANLFAADPKVAEVRPASPNSVFVFGVSPGRTTVAALDEAGNIIAQYEVTVRPSSYSAAEAMSAVARVMPGTHVRVDTWVNGLTISGDIASPAEADRVASIVRGYLSKDQTLDNRLSVLSAVQVNLRVRVAEVNRQVTQQLGINWAALGSVGRLAVSVAIMDPLGTAAQSPNTIGLGRIGGVDLSSVLDLLAQDNLATILAEPNLIAMSGETASFLAGGEYPVPVSSSNNTVSVAYKQYGVSLAFVPTVLGTDRISLRVRPEVSQLSNENAVEITNSSGTGGGSSSNSNLIIPALTVRRAETTVELGSGQSFAIAGMLQSQVTNQASGLPWLGDLPVIGALFRSTKFQRNETELVIVVTPVIVRPVDVASRVHAPTDGLTPSNDVDRLLFNRQLAPNPVPVPGAPGRIPGNAGFILN